MIARLLPFLGLVLLAACTATPVASPGPTSAPTTPPTALPTLVPTPTPVASPTTDAATGFYLRAWSSQALPPRDTFTWLPMLTITDGLFIDGNVAIPAIYPGPLMIIPSARPITQAGIDALIDEARRLGLLEGDGDFTGGAVMPGGRTGHMEIVIDGVTHELTGLPETPVECDDAGRCDAEPGTPGAFAALWRALETSSEWLGPELGPSAPYAPARVALLLTAPPADEPGLSPAPVAWPFETPLAEAGVEFPGAEGERCVTLEGDSLEAMLPVLASGTQLTMFVDEAGTQAGALARVLMPREPSPCPDTAE